ncbi:hypothetical protein LD415_002283 [Salmonella enterica]|nr:hypothetical protein [Salmonella enterica]
MLEDTQNAAGVPVEVETPELADTTNTDTVTAEVAESGEVVENTTEQTKGNASTAQTKAKKPKRKPPEREEIRLAEKPSRLISKEGFALYIGKTVDAVVAMAKANKAPAIYMADPLKPNGNAELYFDREEWDDACKQLVESAPPEWHDWRNRLFLFKPTSGKRKKNTDQGELKAA